MTIRVLDDADYEEQIRINERDRFRGLVLEAAAGKRPTVRVPMDAQLMKPNLYCVGITGVADVTLRGFRIEESKALGSIWLTGASSGALLENLDLVAGPGGDCVEIAELQLSRNDAPIVIQNCALHKGGSGVSVYARINNPPFDQPVPCANVVIRNNEFFDMPQGAIVLAGSPQLWPLHNYCRFLLRNR